ncbi:hypothetical protein HUJ04_010662 [Dendroctonus ponderosae]|nr:hypothetical protein HUJ04_010662 [Dendroctonus ponderosae]
MVSASWFRPFLSWVVVLGENGGSGTTRIHLENCLLFSASLVFFPCLTGGVRLREFLFFLTFKFTSQMAQETFYLKTIISGIHIFKKPRNFQVQLFVPQFSHTIKNCEQKGFEFARSHFHPHNYLKTLTMRMKKVTKYIQNNQKDTSGLIHSFGKFESKRGKFEEFDLIHFDCCWTIGGLALVSVVLQVKII